MEKIESFFKSTKESPYHLSVGAVLVDTEGNIACHYFKKFQATNEDQKYNDFYILMRETVEAGEGLEEAVLRGIKEEFGATGEIEKFIGTLLTKFPRGNVWVEKATLYFIIRLKEFDINARVLEDCEKDSVIQWQSIDFLISKMEEQRKRFERTDFDESEILKRAKKYLS
jgi:ADP-ribose pyrophosphatase YjhB (NUDIX family)